MISSTLSTEVQEALNPVALRELSVLKTIVKELLLLKIGAISVMVPHNLAITLSSESMTAKIKNPIIQFYLSATVEFITLNIVIKA